MKPGNEEQEPDHMKHLLVYSQDENRALNIDFLGIHEIRVINHGYLYHRYIIFSKNN